MGVITVSKGINKVILVCVLAFAFLIRYYPHMVVIDNVGIEEGNMIHYTRLLFKGDYSYVNNLPHAPIFFAFVLAYILPISVSTACFLVSPILGTLSTYLMYEITRNLDTENNALLATILFASLDLSVYRSALFGATGEAFGVFLLFVTIRMYQKYRYKAFILLIPLSYVHIIVFMVGCAWASTLYIYDKHLESKINPYQILVLIIVLGVIGAGVMYFGPHRLAIVNILARGGLFDLSAMFKTVVERMIPQFFGACIGSFLIWGFWCINVYQNRLNRLTILGVVSGLIVVMFLVFSSSHISPYRVLPYLSFLSIFSLSKIKVPYKQTIVLFISLVMVLQIMTVGFETVLFMNESATKYEEEALLWLKEYDPGVIHYQVFSDDMGKQLLLYLLPYNATNPVIISQEDIETSKNSWSQVMDTALAIIQGDMESNMNGSGYLKNFEYILFSERLNTKAVFMSEMGYNQNVYVKTTVPDIWKTASNWMPIYQKNNVIIYEKVNE